MKIFNLFSIVVLATIVLLSSCKPDEDIDPNNPNNITILNTNQWSVVANHIEKKQQGVLGGSFVTQAFSLQKAGELRWFLWFRHMTGYQDPIEIVVNNQNAVTVNKPTGSNPFRPIKTIYGTDTWETYINLDNAKSINVFKNGQPTDIGGPYRGIQKLQASEDGLLNNEIYNGSAMVSHYHYGTGLWKNNSFGSSGHVSTRYNNKTYVANLLNDGTTGKKAKFIIFAEGNTADANGIYPMSIEKNEEIDNAGYIMHSVRHGDNLFVAIDAQWQKTYVVYKINLTNYDIQKVMEEPKVEIYTNFDYLVRYLYAQVEIDPDGNLYIVANRIENQQGHYSIIKYKSTGGREIILKEEDLKKGTHVHAIYFFNNKLYTAVVYREELEKESNPNANSWMSNYHMQIISKN